MIKNEKIRDILTKRGYPFTMLIAHEDLDLFLKYAEHLESECKHLRKDNSMFEDDVKELTNRIQNLEGGKVNQENRIRNLKKKLELLTDDNIILKKQNAKLELNKEFGNPYLSNVGRQLRSLCIKNELAVSITQECHIGYTINFKDNKRGISTCTQLLSHEMEGISFSEMEFIMLYLVVAYLEADIDESHFCRRGLRDMIKMFHENKSVFNILMRMVGEEA